MHLECSHPCRYPLFFSLWCFCSASSDNFLYKSGVSGAALPLQHVGSLSGVNSEVSATWWMTETITATEGCVEVESL